MPAPRGSSSARRAPRSALPRLRPPGERMRASASFPCSFPTAGRVCGNRDGRRVGADSPAPAQRFGPNQTALLSESEAMRETPRRMPRAFAHLSDEAVVALVARSDETALGELYDRFARVAYGLAFRILRDRALAEDAVQEGFMTAWRTADRFMPERAKASTWLLTLVHRRAVDLVRRENRRRAEPLDERVEAALRRLPDQQREALELAYYGGFTQSELAERLGQPVGTIKSRMFAGLARLRELLAETGPDDRTSWTPKPSTT